MTATTNCMTQFDRQLDVFTHGASESEVSVAIGDMSQGEILSFEGHLNGPYCDRAHTLPASFQVSQCLCDRNVSNIVSTLITDPCYWTPQLPFLYKLELELQLADGSAETWNQTVGLRRWEIVGKNLMRERRRIVLRAVVVDSIEMEDLSTAVVSELALVVTDPHPEFLERASELGVSLVVDLRGYDGDITAKLLSCAWQPSVALVIFDASLDGPFYQPLAVRIACIADSVECLDEVSWADVVAVEIDETKRPPEWAATCEKPVIAIRRCGAYAELAEARRKCDQLQADLAPQFDLAGYIV